LTLLGKWQFLDFVRYVTIPWLWYLLQKKYNSEILPQNVPYFSKTFFKNYVVNPNDNVCQRLSSMSVGYDKVSQRFVASQWYMIKVVRDFDRSVKIYWPALSTWLVFNTWKFCRLSVDWSVENTTLAVALSRKYCPCHGPIQKIWPLPWHYPENMTTAMALSRKYDPCRGPIQKIWPLL
jgi:hypothetical protein